MDRLSPCSSNIAPLLPNGGTYPLCQGHRPPDRVRPTPPLPWSQLLGYAGTIHYDLDLLLYAAQARPDWTFLLLKPATPSCAFPSARHAPPCP